MGRELLDKVIGYHYSNSKAYLSMRDGRLYDEVGLIPTEVFVNFRYWANGIPDEAHNCVVEGLLEPEPKSWLENKEFPHLWRVLMHDICKEMDIMLLSFQLKKDDKAYVVERAHMERELYRKVKCSRKPTPESMNEASKKYWESRVPVFAYDGSYSVPQLAIWTPIEFDRLKIEWVKPVDEVWRRVLDNKW